MKKRLKMMELMDSEIDMKHSQWDFTIHNNIIIVPKWGLWLSPAQCFRTGPPAYVARRAGTTTLCRSQLYPPVQGL